MNSLKNTIQKTSWGKYFNFNPKDAKKFKESLAVFSKIFFFFAIAFGVAMFVKLMNIEGIKHYQLPISKLDILPLYAANYLSFLVFLAYELGKLTILALLFFSFNKFLNSVDIASPFQNPISMNHLNKVAKLSMLFFIVDAISNMHIFILDSPLLDMSKFQLFNFEYLFIAYFINVFAWIYKNGVELKQDNDFVV